MKLIFINFFRPYYFPLLRPNALFITPFETPWNYVLCLKTKDLDSYRAKGRGKLEFWIF